MLSDHYSAGEPIRCESAITTWACRIATNASVDFNRRHAHMMSILSRSNEEMRERIASRAKEHGATKQLAEKRELARLVRKSISQWPATQRQVIELRYRERRS